MVKERECDGDCGEEFPLKHLGKIRGKYYCRTCRKHIRENHREETIKSSGIKEDLNKLDRKRKNEAQNKAYANKVLEETGHLPRKKKEVTEKNYIPKRYKTKSDTRNIVQESEMPIKIKGSIKTKNKEKSQSYLTLHEKQMHLRTLMKRGLSFEEAKQRIQDILDQQKEIREDMKAKNKPEKEIKQKQKQMIEELWNS